MEKLKEWGLLLGAFGAVLAVTLYIAGWNADIRYEAQKRDADMRHEAQMALLEALKRGADIRHEAQLALIEALKRDADIRYEAQKRDADTRNDALLMQLEAQNLNADARYEGLMGQIEGVLGQVVGLQKQIDGLQNQIDGLNRNADARSDSLEEQAEIAILVIATLRNEFDAIRASLDVEQYSGGYILAVVEFFAFILEDLHERVYEFEGMIQLDEAGFDGEFGRQESHLVSLQFTE